MSDKFKYTTGLNNVGSYQVSGKPFVTASTISDGVEQQIEFPQVTNNITVKLDSASGNSLSAVKMEGQEFYYENSDTSNVATNGDSRSLSIWVSASAATVGPDNTILISGPSSGAGTQDHFSIRVVGNDWAARHKDYGAGAAISTAINEGWQHLVLTTAPLDFTKFYKNGVEVGTSATGQTNGARLGGGMKLGPWFESGGDALFEIKNAILWDDALTSTQVENLYVAGNDTSHTGYTAGTLPNKLVWVKPEENVGSAATTLNNAGDFATYGNLTLTNAGAGDSATLVPYDEFYNYYYLKDDDNSGGIMPVGAFSSNGENFSVSWWYKIINPGAQPERHWGLAAGPLAATEGMYFGNLNGRDERVRIFFRAQDGNAIYDFAGLSGKPGNILSTIPGFNGYDWNFYTLSVSNASTFITASLYINSTLLEHISSSWSNSSVGGTFTETRSNLSTNTYKYFGFGDPYNSNAESSEAYIKDLILWNGSLNQSQVNTIYDIGNKFYDFSNFTDVEKKAWFRFSSALGDTTSTIQNRSADSATIGSQMDIRYPDSGSLEVSSSSGGGSGGELRVHYRSTGSLPNVATNKHYWSLDGQNESITMNVKSKEIYLSADGGDVDYSLQADLTNIPSSRMYQHTGSGVDE